MMLKKFNVLSSYALAATVTLFMMLLSGCGQRESSSLEEVYPAEGYAFMHDPVFRAQLDAQIRIRDDLRQSRFALNQAFDALLKEHGGNYAAATNTPRGAELVAALSDNNARFVTNRQEVARLTRERMLRAQEDSERIRRGEARAIDISKKKEEK